MPLPSTGHKIIWAGLNVLGQTRNYFSYCVRSQSFCARAKGDLHLENLVFVLTKNPLE